MVHSEVYLNKYVVSIAPFSTPAFTPQPPPIQKTALFACFHFLIFHHFSRGSADPICPYVQMPMGHAAIELYLVPAGPTAGNLPHAAAVGEWDRRTDTVPFHRPRSAQNAAVPVVTCEHR